MTGNWLSSDSYFELTFFMYMDDVCTSFDVASFGDCVARHVAMLSHECALE